jgi:hypothetical protein
MIKVAMRLVWPGFDDSHEKYKILLLVIVMKTEMYALGLLVCVTKLSVTK